MLIGSFRPLLSRKFFPLGMTGRLNLAGEVPDQMKGTILPDPVKDIHRL